MKYAHKSEKTPFHIWCLLDNFEKSLCADLDSHSWSHSNTNFPKGGQYTLPLWCTCLSQKNMIKKSTYFDLCCRRVEGWDSDHFWLFLTFCSNSNSIFLGFFWGSDLAPNPSGKKDIINRLAAVGIIAWVLTDSFGFQTTRIKERKDARQWSKQLDRIFGTELLDQNCASAIFFWRRQPRNFENLSFLARRREHFRGIGADFFVAELPQKRGCFNTQEFTRFLSTGVVSASSHAL